MDGPFKISISNDKLYLVADVAKCGHCGASESNLALEEYDNMRLILGERGEGVQVVCRLCGWRASVEMKRSVARKVDPENERYAQQPKHPRHPPRLPGSQRPEKGRE